MVSFLPFFIVLVFIPRKYELFALISFVYSIKIITVDTIPEKPIGFILYLAGTSCLLHKNFYKNHTLIKIIITIATYFTLLLHSLRFGIQVYIDSLIITCRSFYYFFCCKFLENYACQKNSPSLGSFAI